jgi:hypothetical protein
MIWRSRAFDFRHDCEKVNPIAAQRPRAAALIAERAWWSGTPSIAWHWRSLRRRADASYCRLGIAECAAALKYPEIFAAHLCVRHPVRHFVLEKKRFSRVFPVQFSAATAFSGLLPG